MKKILLSLLLAVTGFAHAQVLPLREQAREVNAILAERLDSVLPPLMKSNGIDMWILIAREYNEDPVLKTMLPAEWLNARRRTMLVFYRDPHSGAMEKLAIARAMTWATPSRAPGTASAFPINGMRWPI
ncbi:MAG TPA: hypothetical protein VGC21_05225 [Telluria sp.]|jgi:hypothetical protein